MGKEQAHSVVFGRNAVVQLLQSGQGVDSLVLSQQLAPALQGYYTALAREAGAVVKNMPAEKLDTLCQGGRHQGVAAFVAEICYATLDDILHMAKAADEPPFLVFCDGVQDPHNLGALIRSAFLCGAHGMVIQKRGAVGITPVVMKSSAGAAALLAVARVTNLGQAIRSVQKAGVFVYCANMQGTPLHVQDFSGAVGLVLGSEGSGVSPHIQKLCDGAVALYMARHSGVDSFNVSVAGGIVMYEVFRRRCAAK